MFFNIDMDNGQEIVGWLAPDNPAATPSLVVSIPGQTDLAVKDFVLRPDVCEAGLHSTGLVGFQIDSDTVPFLNDVVDLTLIDADNKVPIYRRPQPGVFIDKKIFIFELSITAQIAFKTAISPHFGLNYLNTERISLETMIVLLSNPRSASVLACGRSNYSRYFEYLNRNNFLKAALIRPPFEELAERIMLLNLLGKYPQNNTTFFTTGLEPLTEFAQGLTFDDPRSMLNAFRRLTGEQREAIRNPMTKMLGCLPEERPHRSHVATALENLATMNIVGARNRYPLFWDMLRKTLGEALPAQSDLSTSQPIRTLADQLSRIGIVADLLDLDLALYDFVEEAIKQGLEAPQTAGLLMRDSHAR